MLIVSPRFSNNFPYQKINRNEAINLPKHKVAPHTADVSFGLYAPEKAHRVIIKQIAKLIKRSDIKRIAIIPHSNADGDALSSSIALAKFIKKATGKEVDIFTMRSLPDKLKFLNDDYEIKVLNEIFPYNEIPKEEHVKSIQETFGKYDLAISLDTALKEQINSKICESIFEPATKKIKIDHHEIKKDINEYKFADINFIDDTKESTAQLIMQFAHAFGFKSAKKIDPKISGAILTGIIEDTKQFAHVRDGSTIFDDVSELIKTSSIKDIIKKLNETSTKHIKLASKILHKELRFTNNKKTAYLVIDRGKYTEATKETGDIIFEQLQKMSDIDYYFRIIYNSKNPEWINTAVVRSKKEPIIDILKEFNDNRGHTHTRTIKNQDIDPREFAEKIIEALSNL